MSNNRHVANAIWNRAWGGTLGLAVNYNFAKIAKEISPRISPNHPQNVANIRWLINAHPNGAQKNHVFKILNALVPLFPKQWNNIRKRQVNARDAAIKKQENNRVAAYKAKVAKAKALYNKTKYNYNRRMRKLHLFGYAFGSRRNRPVPRR